MKFPQSTKARIHRLDMLFRFFEVDDSLPDPETYKDPFFHRARSMGPAVGSFLQSAEFDDSATYEKESFRRIVLARDPFTGRELWAWVPCEIDRRLYR